MNKPDTSQEKEKIGKVETLMWFRCNCNCMFCSVGHKIAVARKKKGYGSKSAEDIKKDIDYAASIGAIFSFSGGEPTIRPDLPSLIEYAKSKEIKDIQVQSNGRRYFYEEYCKLLIDSGATEFAVSFHSPREEIQDKLMGVKGSYGQTLQGIKNLRKMNQQVKVTMVITKLNYRDMPRLTRMLLKLGVSEIRYVFVVIDGYLREDPGTVRMIVPRMSDVIPYLRECLDMFDPKVAWMAVFNIPHCLLKGYTGHIVDMTQAATELRGSDFIASIKDNRKRDKVKIDRCEPCIFNNICFGVWEKYAEIHGTDEICPVTREDIKKT